MLRDAELSGEAEVLRHLPPHASVLRETRGGHGLIARGVVTSVQVVARQPGKPRQTPRVGLTVRRTALATRPLGRRELKPSADRDGGQPAAELHFKFYRQATNKVIGLSDEAAAFLDTFVA